LGIVIFFAFISLPKAAKELLGSCWWVVVAIYLAGRFQLVEGILKEHGVF
jgi:hypothetical protein